MTFIFGLTLPLDESWMKEALEFAVNFLIIFFTALVVKLVFIGTVPNLEQIYVSVIQALVPALFFLVGKRGLQSYITRNE